MSAETTGAQCLPQRQHAHHNGSTRQPSSSPRQLPVVICDNSAGNGTDGNYVVNEQSADTVGRFEHSACK